MIETPSETILLDVVSDVMCPWCYIGKRRLEQALAISRTPVDITWRPYQLDGTLPPEGKDRSTYLADKFGSAEQAKSIYANIKAAGEAEAIPFHFERIEVSPNTLDAHRLIRWAGTAGKLSDDKEKQNTVVEALFKAYFVDGRNIGNKETLVEIAADNGMDATLTSELLTGDQDKDLVQREIELAHRIGVTGVPTFVLGNTYAVVGAQEAEQLAAAIERTAENLKNGKALKNTQ